jgi:hypothetical protein
MSTPEPLAGVLRWVAELDAETRAILATHEASTDRILTLEGSYEALEGLSLDQEQLFRESLRALEVKHFQAAHVLAWAAFIDYLHNLLMTGHRAALKAARAKWTLDAPEDLRDYADYQVIEAGKAAGIYSKTTMKALHGLLNRRNECAHPSEYFPDLNETLGYIGELFKRIKQLRPKDTPP